MLKTKYLGLQDYQTVFDQMKSFTVQRTNEPDQLWFLQHASVFTLGQAGDKKHIIHPGNIPIVQSDRGGQVTYHGPGQLIVYFLLDLKKHELGIRSLVSFLESSIIELLASFNIKSTARKDAPGVYVDGAKIASIGLKIRKGFSYHGLALNVDMDLEPFKRINPCGFEGLNITQLKDLNINQSIDAIQSNLLEILEKKL